MKSPLKCILCGIGISLALSHITMAQIPPPLGAIPDSGGGSLLGNPEGGDAAVAPATPSLPSNNFLEQTEKDINAQNKGQYPQMDRKGGGSIAAIQESWNNPSPSSGQSAPGVVRFSWRPDYVMPVRTREFMATTIVLPSFETITRTLLGDVSVFEATKIKNNIVVVRR
jgi:hypothetical protein